MEHDISASAQLQWRKTYIICVVKVGCVYAGILGGAAGGLARVHCAVPRRVGPARAGITYAKAPALLLHAGAPGQAAARPRLRPPHLCMSCAVRELLCVV